MWEYQQAFLLLGSLLELPLHPEGDGAWGWEQHMPLCMPSYTQDV